MGRIVGRTGIARVAALVAALVTASVVSAAPAGAAGGLTTVYRFAGQITTDDGFVVGSHWFATDPAPPPGYAAESPGGAFALRPTPFHGDRPLVRCQRPWSDEVHVVRQPECPDGVLLGYAAILPTAELRVPLYSVTIPNGCDPDAYYVDELGRVRFPSCPPVDQFVTTSSAEVQYFIARGMDCGTVPESPLACLEGFVAPVPG
jgi:hypothetical protein